MSLTRDDYSELAAMIDRFLEERAGHQMGFTVLVYVPGQPGIAHYVSNGERADCITAMREAADRLEKKG